MSSPAPDPLRTFPSIIAGVLALEVIVVLLALAWVAKLGDGVATWQGVLVGALALALIVAAGMVRRPYGLAVAVALQVVLILCWLAIPVIGIVGVIFGVAFALLFWMRYDLAKRIAQGRLPSQREPNS